MKAVLVIFLVVVLTACASHNENAAAKADSSNLITDSAALMNKDTTSVIGVANVGKGQMRIDSIPARLNK